MSSSSTRPSTPPGTKFDIIAWYPHYQSSVRYFLNVAQHSYPCQALAAFLNIRLPYQRSPPTAEYLTQNPSSPSSPRTQAWVSVIPYLRRLVATGFDKPGILHGWFGDDWAMGIGPMHESERRNFLFAAKSGGWSNVKRDYDNVGDECIPFLRPLDTIHGGEIESAEASWSNWLEVGSSLVFIAKTDWLQMEDWMLGPRAYASGGAPPPPRAQQRRQGE